MRRSRGTGSADVEASALERGEPALQRLRGNLLPDSHFASLRTYLFSLAARCARVLTGFTLENERAQGMPGARCTRGLVRNGEWMRARAYRLSGGTRHPLRNGFTAYAVLSPATNSSCHRRRRIQAASQSRSGSSCHRRLGTSNGCQNHTVLPYAKTSFVLRACNSLTRFNPPCDRISAPTLSRPPHPIPRS
jgi:hypothetical protein